MKLSKRSAIIAVTSIIALMGAGGVSAYYATVKSSPLSSVKETAPEVANSKPAIKEDVAVKEENATPVVNDTPEVSPTTVPSAPDLILSSQQYGEKYLDLSTPEAKECFDWIQRDFPARFEPEVRKHNVQALSVFASTCSTGYNHPRTSSTDPKIAVLLILYGPDGAFFDSELAKSRWQD